VEAKSPTTRTMSVATTPEISGEPSTIEFTRILRLTYG
jgi:hypothetical protein